MNVSQVIAPEFFEAARAMITRKAEGDAPTAYELEIIAKSGARVSLELSTRIIFQNGSAVGVQGIARDITERKQTQESLVDSERRYRALSEGIMHQVWTAQPDGKLDYVNRRALEYFGRSLEQMLDKEWQGVVHPEDLPECLNRWAYSLRTGNDYVAEISSSSDTTENIAGIKRARPPLSTPTARLQTGSGQTPTLTKKNWCRRN
jgi:PAS domain-containing protein